MLPFSFGYLKNFKRYRQIANVLARNGFGFIIDQLGLWQPRIEEDRRYQRYSPPERLRMVLEQLGPTFIKLGQLLSTRPDIIPKTYLIELAKLQDDVAPVSYEEVRQVLVEEGIEPEEVFTSLEPNPIASASIGQVHRAVMKNGQQVVVKIQRPGIAETIKTDLEILLDLAKMAEKRTSWGKLYQVTQIVNEFGEALRAELDFTREGRNMEHFRQNMASNPDVIIPRVIWELTNSRILVLEYIDGIKISDVELLRQAGINIEEVVRNIIKSLFEQVYEHGFFHADPHPGNLAVAPGNKIVYYDFGQVGTIDEVLKELGMDLVLAMVRYDVNGVTRALLQMGMSTRHVNREELRRDVARLQRKYYGVPFSQINLGEALAELIQLSFKHRVRIPPELSLLVKMLITMESLVRNLAPEISPVDIAEPYARRILLKRYSPGRLMHRAVDVVYDYANAARNIPGQIESLLDLLEQGGFILRLDIPQLQRLNNRADIISNRLSIAIIIGSLIIGTSLMSDKFATGILTHVPLMEIGFILAAILGLFLIYSVLRSGRY